MGAVSVSIGRPSRRRRSSTLAASATISVPMPSPGSMAIFIAAPDKRAADRHGEQSKPWFLLCLGDCSAAVRSEEPRLLGFALRLERPNLVGAVKRERDVGERRSYDGAESVVAERPRRMLARAAAAEIAASKQNLRALVARLVEHKVRVRAAA